MKKDNNKQVIMLSVVVVITLIIVVIGATYAYFQTTSGAGSSTDVNVITATTDLLTFKIDKEINISLTQSDLKKGNGSVSDSTKASATLTASNSKDVDKTTGSYNIYFIIENNDFEYTTSDAKPELLLTVTDPNGNKVENITGLLHTENGFDITTRTGGFLLVPDYDIEATRGNTTTQEWNVEVTIVNLDTDQVKNMGKSLSGKLYVTRDKMSSYELTQITNMETTTTYNSITTTLNVQEGSAQLSKYYYGIEKATNTSTQSISDVKFIEIDKPSYTFSNLDDNITYKVYSYGIDKNGIKTNTYETEVTTSNYTYAKINSVTHSVTLNSITLSVNATKGDNEIVKYYFSKDNGATYEESETNSYVFNNLNDTTEYKIKVKVLDSYGRYSTEYFEAITTDAYIVPSITNVTTTSTADSITINITGQNGDGTINKYYYSKDNGSNYVESTSSSYTFSNLTSNTTFYIKVYVKDNNNRESSVSTASIATKTLTIADYVKAQYIGTQGSNGIYYHNTTLTNGAKDNSYRYAGANPNNYVCLGSTENPCPDANLFRIIGVFGDQVKLIKANPLVNQVAWDGRSGRNTWSTSTLNTYLNETYLTSLGILSDKIATMTWKVGGNDYANINNAIPEIAYQNEIVNPVTTNTLDNLKEYNTKMGLMYVSDYGYAADPSAWTATLTNYKNSSITSVNWLYLNAGEWTITRRSGSNSDSYYINKTGFVSGANTYGKGCVRPTFYLTSTVTYASGTGTSSDPIRIN